MLCKRVRLGVLLGATVFVAWGLNDLARAQRVEVAEENEPAADATPRVFLLGTKFHPAHWVESEVPKISGELPRELVRQALLIAARDELGLPTRDATLREPFVDSAGVELVPLEVITDATLDKVLSARLSRKEGDRQQEIWQAKYTFPLKSYMVYMAVIPPIEKDSRTTMVEALRKAGYGKPPASGDETEPVKDAAQSGVPDEVERLLSIMSFAPQFAAVRWAHQANREQGQSAAALSVLVRGYAHLAMLSECYWNSMSRAYKARALLYAERMTVAYPDSSEAFWHRAYARVIIGLHGGAISEMKEIAEKFKEEEPPANRLPACMKLIEPCCRFDSKELLAVGAEHKPLLPLAHFLDFRIAWSIDDQRLLVSTSEETLKHCPDVCEIYDLLRKRAPLGIMRWAARTGPEATADLLPARLNEVAGLPEDVRQILDGQQPGLLSRLFGGADAEQPPPPPSYRLAEALVTAGRVGTDSQEPSWSVLGRMIQEVDFVNSLNVLLDRHNAVQSSQVEAVDHLRPFVKGHPYAAYVESFRVLSDQQPEEFAKIIEDLRFVEPQFHMSRSLWPIWNARTRETERVGLEASRGFAADFTMYCLIARQRNSDWTRLPERHKRNRINEFREVSPHCPEGLLTAIKLMRDPTSEQIADWEKQVENFPKSLYALGRLYWNRREYDAAARCLEKSIAISPTFNSHLDLATVYEAQGKPELWQPTMEKFLEVEDYGLDHARVHNAIAHRLMDHQHWEAARPHAIKTAETYSAWGMACALRCFEGLEEWEEAEVWVRRSSESYTGRSRMAWYYWCCRNGRGDLKAASDLARQYALSPGATATSSGCAAAGMYHLLQGDRRKALDFFHKSFQKKSDVIICARVLALAVELEKPALQDEMCQELKKYILRVENDTGDVTLRFYKIVESALRSKDPQKPDRDAMWSVMKDYDRRGRTNVGYIFGRVLELHGQPEKAKEFYREVLDIRLTARNSYTLAGVALARLSKEKDGAVEPKNDGS